MHTVLKFWHKTRYKKILVNAQTFYMQLCNAEKKNRAYLFWTGSLKCGTVLTPSFVPEISVFITLTLRRPAFKQELSREMAEVQRPAFALKILN